LLEGFPLRLSNIVAFLARRYRDDFPEHVRYLAAKTELEETQALLAQHATPDEIEAGLEVLETPIPKSKFKKRVDRERAETQRKVRRRQLRKYFIQVQKAQQLLDERHRQRREAPDYVPTPVEAEHLRTELELHALRKEQAAARQSETFSIVLNLQPKIDALQAKEAKLAPLVRRTRAKRLNELKFDLKSAPTDQFAGKIAQKLRAEANAARISQ